MTACVTAAAQPVVLGTAKEYFQLPCGEPRLELVDGHYFMAPSASFSHQYHSHRISLLLGNFIDENQLGVFLAAPMDVELEEGSVVQPDLLFISNARRDIIGDHIIGAPDLVIEIFSLSTRQRDEGLKLQLYQRSGVLEVWLVDLGASSITVHDFSEASPRRHLFSLKDTLTSAHFPKLKLALSAIFA